MAFVYYTGMGDYRKDHYYTKKEFIVLCNKNKDRFNVTIADSKIPVLDSENHTDRQFQMLLNWTGAEYIIFC